MNAIRNLVVLAAAVSACTMQAHVFSFRNKCKMPVIVAMQLKTKGDWFTKTAPAGGEAIFDFKFGTGEWGLCLDSDNLQLNGVEAPIIMPMRNVYDKIMAEVRSSGKITSVTLGTEKRGSASALVCGSAEFEIVPDMNNNPRAVRAP